MTPAINRKERSVLGALLNEFPEALPKSIASLLHHAPDSFDDLRNGTIAIVIREMQLAGQPVYSDAVSEYLAAKKLEARAGGVGYLMELCQAGLPLSTAEIEAADIWESYQVRRAKTTFADAAKSMEAAPEKARTIIQSAMAALGSLGEQNGHGMQLTLRTPDEILAMTFDDSDLILGERLLAKGQSLVIAGQGGAGKSRLALQLAASVTSGRKFLALQTGGADLRWLFLQTENSNRRLHDDLYPLKAWLGAEWPSFQALVTIHTLENDSDGFVSLESPENVAAIGRAIEATKPDVVLLDPLNDFAIGDLNKDADMRATMQAISRVCRRGNPFRAIIPLHHALTGRGGAVKATGYDRASFARNSKVLLGWARGQINLAPIDSDNNDRLIVACGKCSNGREFQAFAIRLNPQTHLYECDPTVDVKAWEAEMNGKKEPGMTPERVSELCKPVSTKAELAKSIMNDCGCSRATAYRHIAEAERKRKIRFNKTSETYSRA